MSDPAIIEAAAQALFAAEMPYSDWRVLPSLHDKFRARARAVTPLIRAQALEEAALTIEERLLLMDDYRRDLFTVRDGATAIRALKEQP